MISISKRYAFLIYTILLSVLLTACGGAKEGATNEWVMTNPEAQSPDKTVSILNRAEEVVFAGLQQNDQELKTLLTAYDLNGEVLWEAEEKLDYGYDAIAEAAAGGYVVAGGQVYLENTNPTYRNPGVAKYSALGVEEWSVTLADAEFSMISIGLDDSNQSYVLTRNWTNVDGISATHFGLHKVDVDGVIVWSKEFSDKGTNREIHLAVDSVGNSYVAYELYSGPVVKQFDVDGNQRWDYAIPSDENPYRFIQALLIDANDRAVIQTTVGKQVIPNFSPPLASSTYAFTRNGAIAWEYHLPAESTDYKLNVESSGMTIDAEGNYYLVQTSNRQDVAVPCPFCEIVTEKLYLTKLSPEGNELWQQILTVNHQAGTDFVSVNDGLVAVINDEYIRAFDPDSGELMIEQDNQSIFRYLTGGFISEEGDFYLISDAEWYRSEYQIEKWVRDSKVAPGTE